MTQLPPMPPQLSKLMPWHQATRRFTRKQVEGFVTMLGQWMTQHPGFPATANVTQADDRTWVLTVTVDDTPALPPT